MRDASDALAAWKRSGLSLHAFAVEFGLEPSKLYRWRRRLQLSDAVVATSSALFQEVALPASADLVLPTPQHLEVVLRSGRTVRVPQGFDPDALARFVAALEA